MQEFKLRASSISDLFDCAKRWEARNILNIRMSSSGAAHLGTSIHAGTGAYDVSTMEGAQISVDDATGVMIDTLYHTEDDVLWDEITPKKAEPIARQLLLNYCEAIAPAREYVGVEARCDDLHIIIDSVLLTLTGTIDRVRNENGALGISDLKTGKSAVATDGTVAARKHAIQLGAYEILAQHTTGIPMNADAEIIGMQTNGKARIGSGLIERPRDLLLREGGLLEMAVAIMKAGLFPPNPRSMLCGDKFCPAWKTCVYK